MLRCSTIHVFSCLTFPGIQQYFVTTIWQTGIAAENHHLDKSTISMGHVHFQVSKLLVITISGKSHQIPWKTIIFPWFFLWNHHFPMIFPRCSYGLPWKTATFLWFSYGISTIFRPELPQRPGGWDHFGGLRGHRPMDQGPQSGRPGTAGKVDEAVGVV